MPGAHVAIPAVRVSVAVFGDDISVLQVTDPPVLGSGKCSEGVEWMVEGSRTRGLSL